MKSLTSSSHPHLLCFTHAAGCIVLTGPECSAVKLLMLFAVCLINKTGKLLGFGLYLLVGLQDFWQSSADTLAFRTSISFLLGFLKP